MHSVRIGKIYGINGPVIYLKGKTDFQMSEMVYVGNEKLVGEVISLDKEMTTVQVYEETSGLKPGELVEGSGAAVSVTLAPGILNNILTTFASLCKHCLHFFWIIYIAKFSFFQYLEKSGIFYVFFENFLATLIFCKR